MPIADLFSLEGATALITGGSRGIGRMIAAGFIDQGATVYISSRDAKLCALTAAALGPQCVSLPGDVSTLEGCKKLAAAYSERETKLNILVNNAGSAWSSPFDSFPEEGWDQVLDLNMKAPFFLTQQLLRFLKASACIERPAKVINVASAEGLRISSWNTYSYQASKAGLLHLTRRLAAQLISEHIHVTALAPGHFPSDMNPPARDHEEFVARSIPAQRVGGADDIAAAAIFLASRAGDYVVGSALSVDGGLAFAAPGQSPQLPT